MKNLLKNGFILGAFLFGMASCNQQGGAVEEAQEANEEIADDTPMEDEAEDLSEFMTKAASGGMMEVELGKMAQQQAQNQQVKDFGTMMVTDHTKANNELKALAASKNIILPDTMGEAHMDHVEDLRDNKGAEFDEAYMDLMVSDHKEDVEMFEDAANNLQDAEAKAFAAKTLPVLQKHMAQARMIDSTMAAKQ